MPARRDAFGQTAERTPLYIFEFIKWMAIKLKIPVHSQQKLVTAAMGDRWQQPEKKKNMFSEETENKLTIKDKLIQFFFTVADRETGRRRIRNSEFAKNIVTNHFQKKFEEQKKRAYKFKLDTLVEYPKKFAEKYRNENKPFVININKRQIIDLQIIHPCMIDNPKRNNTKKFGFTVHLPFDTTDKDAMEELELFKKREYFNDFKHNSNEGIEDYILDCSEDYKLLDKMMQRILVDLKGYKKEDEILIDHFFV